MKRLLCILSSLTAGGAETFLMKVYRALPPQEYQLDFIVSEGDGCYTQEVLERGGHIYQIPFRTKNPIKALRGITKVVKENGYSSVLKLGNTPIAALDLVAAKFGGAKILAMRSCNALTTQSVKEKVIDTLLRPLLNMVANVKLAPSMLAAEFTFGKYHAHKDVHLIKNGVDLSKFCFDAKGREVVRSELCIQDKLVVGHIGRFHEQKNHLYLLEIFREIKSIRNDAVLLLVGTGKLEDTVRNRVKELDLENAVMFLGERFDIPQLLSGMDVFVFPSLHEGMPNTVIEAQALGLPCVIADTITKEADLTGLVTYLSLDSTPQVWAQTAIKAADTPRVSTTEKLRERDYDINNTAKNLIKLMLA